MNKSDLKPSENVPNGVFVLNNAFHCEGGAVDGEPYGEHGRLPALVLTMPMAHGTSSIHLIFNDPRALLKFKQAMMDLDMTAIYPGHAVGGVLTDDGKMDFDPEALRKHIEELKQSAPPQ